MPAPAMNMRPTLLPSLSVGLGGLMWGVWWLPLRWLEGSGISGDWATIYIYAIATAILAPFMWPRRASIRAGGVPLLVVGGLTGVAFSLWNHALIDGNIVRVTLLFYLAPVWAILLKWLIQKVPLRPVRGLAIACGLAGAAVIMGVERGFHSPFGAADGVALLSGMIFAYSAIHAERAPEIGGWDKTLVAILASIPMALLLVILLPLGPVPDGAAFLAALPAAIVCMFWLLPVMSLVLWGTGKIDGGRVSILLLMELIGAVVSSAILTDEPFGAREILGCVLVAGAGLLEGLDELLGPRTRAAAPAAGTGS
jgi:drug/metabolite transporter (DMT)-like permease